MSIDCVKTGRRFSDSYVAEECQNHCRNGAPCPFEREQDKYKKDEPITMEQLLTLDTEPTHKRGAGIGVALFGLILVSVGIAWILGMGKYWPIIPITVGLTIVIHSLSKKH